MKTWPLDRQSQLEAVLLLHIPILPPMPPLTTGPNSRHRRHGAKPVRFRVHWASVTISRTPQIADQLLKNDEYRQDRAAEGRNLVWQQRRRFGVRAEHQLIAKPNKGVGDEVDARIADGFPRQGTEI